MTPMGTKGGEDKVATRYGSSTVRVGIFDENEMFAIGIRASLVGARDIEIVAEGDAEGDREMDVAVVSPRAARQLSFSCPLVVCGEVPNRVAAGNVVLAELPRGSLTPGHLLVSVQAAAAGLRVVPPQPDGASSKLDGRRLEVLRLLATGADTREIARSLGYSDRTIKSVIREIQLALGTRNRVQAVAEGVRQGLIGMGADT